jgi:putative effector of murein hydrolase LrgA (UPF0299 family)
MPAITSTSERRERGMSVMVIGLGIWLADLLVIFFLPAGVKLWRYASFITIVVVLAVLGLILMVIGYKRRGQSDEE